MNVLIIDTSLTLNFIVLSKKKYHLNVLDPDKKQSINLVQTIKDFLLLNNTTLQEIEVFSVGIGPGSFTGTRVGLMCIKTLSYVFQKPIVTFCSLLPFAIQASRFAVVGDAKAGKFYILKGVYQEGHYLFDEPEVILKSQLSQYQHLCLIGPESLCIDNITVEKTPVNVDLLVSYCKQQFIKHNVHDSKKLLPLYLRDPVNI